VKKILLTLLLLILTNCTPTYRILTVDYNYIPNEFHKYEIINLENGIVDTIYDHRYLIPGLYVKLNDHPSAVIKIEKILE